MNGENTSPRTQRSEDAGSPNFVKSNERWSSRNHSKRRRSRIYAVAPSAM